MPNDETRLKRILLDNGWFLSILQCVRACDPPEWYIGGGVIRSLVWDALHHFSTPTPIRDVDVIFFDPAALTKSREDSVQKELEKRMPDIPWQVKNQAAVHLWYEQKFGFPVDPLCSSFDGVTTWPETATSVAVRLLSNDDLLVAAPCGLADLFGMVLRRNPKRVTPEIFERRVRQKMLKEKWPLVQVYYEDTRTHSGTPEYAVHMSAP